MVSIKPDSCRASRLLNKSSDFLKAAKSCVGSITSGADTDPTIAADESETVKV